MGNVLCVPRVDRTVEAESAAPRKKRNLRHWFRKKVLRKRPRAADTPPVSTYAEEEDEESDVLVIDKESGREEEETRELAMLMELQERPHAVSARPNSPPTVSTPSAVCVRSSRHVVSASYSIDAIHGVAIVSVAGRLFVVRRSASSVVMSPTTTTEACKTASNTVNRSRSLTLMATSHSSVETQLTQLRDLVSSFNSGYGFEVDVQVRNGVITLVTVTTDSKLSLSSASALSTQARNSTFPALPPVTGSTVPALTWRPNSGSKPTSLPEVPSYLLVAAQSYESTLSVPETRRIASSTSSATPEPQAISIALTVNSEVSERSIKAEPASSTSSSTSTESLKLLSPSVMTKPLMVCSKKSSVDILPISCQPNSQQVQNSAMPESSLTITAGSEIPETIMEVKPTSTASSSTSIESIKLLPSNSMAKSLMVCSKTSLADNVTMSCLSKTPQSQGSALLIAVQDLNKPFTASSEVHETTMKAKSTSTTSSSTSIESVKLLSSNLLTKPFKSCSKTSSADIPFQSNRSQLQSSSLPKPMPDSNITFTAGPKVPEIIMKAQSTSIASSSSKIESLKSPSSNSMANPPMVCPKLSPVDILTMPCLPNSQQVQSSALLKSMPDSNITCSTDSEVPCTTMKAKKMPSVSSFSSTESFKFPSPNFMQKPLMVCSKPSPADMLQMPCLPKPPQVQNSALLKHLSDSNTTFTAGSEVQETILKAKPMAYLSKTPQGQHSALLKPVKDLNKTFTAGSEVHETTMKTKSTSTTSSSTSTEALKLLSSNAMTKSLMACSNKYSADKLPISCLPKPPQIKSSALLELVPDSNIALTTGPELPKTTMKAESTSIASTSTSIESRKLLSSNSMAKSLLVYSPTYSADNLAIPRQPISPQMQRSTLPGQVQESTISVGSEVLETILKANQTTTASSLISIDSVKLPSSNLMTKPQMMCSKTFSAGILPKCIPQVPDSKLSTPMEVQNKKYLQNKPTDTQPHTTSEETKSAVEKATNKCEINKLISIAGHVPSPPTTTKPNNQFRRQLRRNDCRSTNSLSQSPGRERVAEKVDIIKPKKERYQHFIKSTPKTVPMKEKVSDFMVPKRAKAPPPTPLKLKVPKPHMNAIPAIAKESPLGRINWRQVEGKGPHAKMSWCTKAPLFNVTFPPLGKRLLKRAGSIERIQECYVLPQTRQIDIVKLECSKFPGIRVPMNKRDEYNMMVATEKERNDSSDKTSSSDDESWGSEPSESQ